MRAGCGCEDCGVRQGEGEREMDVQGEEVFEFAEVVGWGCCGGWVEEFLEEGEVGGSVSGGGGCSGLAQGC